ncbi:MAG: glycosyltransferase family 1 protein, partial [Lachnospiraceae bacterium]|nr:glycosyltransferase family 1 protein [Lachnospiraceae bacterium]
QSKLSLNIMSWHKDSMTERVANMMINRCLVVSDESGYLVERYGGEEPDMLLFDLEKIRELPGQIRYYLEHDNKRRATIERAYQKAIQNETWEKRTGEIVKAIKNSCVYL